MNYVQPSFNLMLWNVVLPLFIYWLLFFVVQFIMVEYAQTYLYEETTPYFGLKVLIGSGLLAAMATYFRPNFATMLTNDIHWTALQALAWVGIFTLLYQFHPWHALALGLAGLVSVPALATMTIDSLSRSERVVSRPTPQPVAPHRGSLNPTPATPRPQPTPGR